MAVWAPCCTSRAEGVGVLISNTNINVLSYEIVVPGRCLEVVVEYGGKHVRILNCYAPAEKRERKEFLEIVRMHMPGRIPTVVLGDFNCIRKSGDRHGSGNVSGTDVTSKLLNKLVGGFCLRDAAVEVEGSVPAHTFFSDKGSVSFRIDFCFVSEFLNILSYTTEPVLFSDHVLLSCKVDLETRVNFGKGVWKMNCSILEEEGVHEEFCVFFETLVLCKEDYVDVLQWWDWV